MVRAEEAWIERNGADSWAGWLLTDIMNPQLHANAIAERKQLYDRQKDLAEYFGARRFRLHGAARALTVYAGIVETAEAANLLTREVFLLKFSYLCFGRDLDPVNRLWRL